MINIIVAYSRRNGIGIANKLPWYLGDDIRTFKKKTIGEGNNSVIMGRKTWESLPYHSKPLRKRHNIIVSNTLDGNLINDQNCTVVCTLKDALQYCNDNHFSKNWVIGGEGIYKSILDETSVDEIHVTNINNDITCDTYFPSIPKNYNMINASPWKNEGVYIFRYETYKNYSDTNLNCYLSRTSLYIA